jgi:hypothetical protein
VLISTEEKRALIQRIIAELAKGLDVYAKAARNAHAEATHESSKAENKYDTRGLEASYLARGQSKQAAETAQAIEDFEKLPVREFGVADEIDVGALVQLKAKSASNFYFIASRGGGTEVMHGKDEVVVITPSSPLGQQIVGRKQGDKVKLQIAGASTEFKIAAVG